jgi:hypothetical protein
MCNLKSGSIIELALSWDANVHVRTKIVCKESTVLALEVLRLIRVRHCSNKGGKNALPITY